MDEEIKEEDIINEDNIIIDYEKIKKVIDAHLAKCICKIYQESVTDEIPVIKTGTGFFCNFSSKNVKFLMTNNHVLNQEFLDNEKSLNIIIEKNGIQKKKQLNLSKKRYHYTNIELDFTIIEIRKDDNILNFLEIDENINLDFPQGEKLFSLHYAEGEQLKYSHGIYLKKNNKFFLYTIGTKHGSSGAPIFLLNNYKIIGLHKASLKKQEKEKINVGIPIHLIIGQLNNLIHNFIFVKENNKEIKITLTFLTKNSKEICLKFGVLTSILKVKEKINNIENFENCLLIYNGTTILNDDKTFYDYNIIDDATLHVLETEKEISIDINQKIRINFHLKDYLEQGHWILDDVYPSYTILKIKNILQKKEGIQADKYHYFYKRQELKDNKTLADYKIINDSTINMGKKAIQAKLFDL